MRIRKPEDLYTPFGTKALPTLTGAVAPFIDDYQRLLKAKLGVYEVAVNQLKVRAKDLNATFKKLKKAGWPNNPTERRRITAQVRETQKISLHLSTFTDFMREVSLTRTVDSFLSYISELLALIYSNRPEMLKSGEQVKLDYILQYKTMDELVTAITERQVERLAYKGLKDLNEHLGEHMDFKLFEDSADLEDAARIVEYRNLFTHNRGIVSSISARRLPALTPLVGKPIAFTTREGQQMTDFLFHAIFDIDVRAAAKFRLPVKKIPTAALNRIRRMHAELA